MNQRNSTNQLVRLAILVFWSFFWLFNSIDKVLGGSSFLWVGRDRFAQFQKFFASAGLSDPFIANLGLVIAAGFEILAFVFFTGSVLYFLKSNYKNAHVWFFIGIVLTLVTFTIFAVGDHIFGDRFELLEHTLFWFVTLFTWVVYKRLENVETDVPKTNVSRSVATVIFITVLLVSITTFSIFRYNRSNFYQRTSAISAKQVGENMYKFAFPFLGGSTVFEKSIDKFKKENPDKRILHIYTAPDALRLKKADGLIFYILTESKE